jgi:hypothetical protein
MITICIPVFNWDVRALINELSQQTKLLNIPFEIIIIDDCSSEEFKKINNQVCEKENYIQLDKNIGRAKIRNLFLRNSHYDNLLFLDCDSLIISKDFVLKYIETIKQNESSVICGGRKYDSSCPGRSKMLRWKYGIKKESQPVNIRILSPNKSFMTNNFLINRKIFEQVKFDERISGYGNEDTLFGYQLKKNGIQIKHIDNPILNGDVEENVEYLKKTEDGIRNLIQILPYVDYDKDFMNDVKILKFYQKMKSYYLINPIKILFTCSKPILKFMLIRGFVNLRLFDFYKFGVLINNYKHRF